MYEKHLEIIKVKGDHQSIHPTIIFVHGAHVDARSFSNYQSYFLKNGFHSLSISLSGHGNSKALDIHELSLSDYVHDLKHVIASMSHKPILIGHSMGAAVVYRYLYEYPNSIYKAVLCAPPPIEGMDPKSDLGLFFKDMMGLLRNIRALKPSQSISLGHLLKHMMFNDLLPNDAFNVFRNTMGLESQLVKKELLQPILPYHTILSDDILVIGSKKDRLVTQEMIIDISRNLGVSYHLLEHSSHFMMLDPYWEESAQMILSFIL